jgi:hypothetical protein
MPGPNHGANHPALPPSSKVNVVDMGSAIKCARLLAQELGGKKLFTPQTSLGPEEWGGVMKDSRQQIIGKMNDLFMQAKLKPYDLTRNDLDNRAKDITGDLKNLAAATGALTGI